MMLDLPAPEGPTMPMNSPGLIVRSRFLMLGVACEGYVKLTLSKVIAGGSS